MSHLSVRWTPAARRRALAWLVGWATYGVAVAGLRIALTQATFPGSWPVIGLMTLAVVCGWAMLTPAFAWLERHLRRARIGWGPTLLVHAVVAVATSLVISLIRWGALSVVQPPGSVALWPLAVMRLDVDVGTYAATLWLLRALATHREFVSRSRRALALETELARARLEFLQRQLQPHFLFNALNAIAQLAREAPATSSGMTQHLAGLLRTAVEGEPTAEVTVREEIASLESYLAIERLRFGDRIAITQHVDDAAWPALVPKLLLQPLVENAVRHGLRHAQGHGVVEIRITAVDATLRVAVENTGPVVPVSSASGHGIGLRNTRGRLAQLYRGRFGLSMGTDGTGRTTVSIELPLHTEPETEPADVIAAAEVIGAPPEGTGLTGEHPVRVEPARGTLGDPMLRRFGLLWLGVALLWTAQDVVGPRLAGLETSVGAVMRVDLLAALVWALATPAVLWLGRKVRVRQGHWLGTVAVHVAASVLLSLGQVSLVLHLTRLPHAVLMSGNANQLTLNVMLYAAIVAWTHAREFRDWYRERALAAARLQHELEQTRLQSVGVDVRPQLVLRLLDRMAAVVRVDPPRGEWMAEKLADLLRRLLDTAGQTSHAIRDQLALLGLAAELHTLATGEPVRVRVDLEPRWLDRHVAPPGLVGAMGGDLGDPTGGREIAVTVGVASAERGEPERLLITADAPVLDAATGHATARASGYQALVRVLPYGAQARSDDGHATTAAGRTDWAPPRPSSTGITA